MRERKIQIVKINLNKIYEQLNKWSYKSQKYHIKMNELYQLAKDLRDKKRAIEVPIGQRKSLNKPKGNSLWAWFLLGMGNNWQHETKNVTFDRDEVIKNGPGTSGFFLYDKKACRDAVSVKVKSLNRRII